MTSISSRHRALRWLATGVGLVLALPAFGASPDWRLLASRDDDRRFEALDRAWNEALASARAGGHGAELDRLGVLVEPDARQPRPMPPTGVYRCRTIKIGARTSQMLSFVAYGWFSCRVSSSPNVPPMFAKVTGSQRTRGRLYAEDHLRLVYLGAQNWSADEAPAVYGRDAERDQIGSLERIGPRRWRLVLPFPLQESLLDVIEIVR